MGANLKIYQIKQRMFVVSASEMCDVDIGIMKDFISNKCNHRCFIYGFGSMFSALWEADCGETFQKQKQ